MSGGSAADRVRAMVRERFPELAKVASTVERAGPNWVYTFRGSVAMSPGGPEMRQVVRVTVDRDGKVVKVVASR